MLMSGMGVWAEREVRRKDGWRGGRGKGGCGSFREMRAEEERGKGIKRGDCIYSTLSQMS